MENEQHDEPLWTSQQCADFLGVSEGTLRKGRWRARTKGTQTVPYVRVQGSVRYVPAVVRAFVGARLHVS